MKQTLSLLLLSLLLLLSTSVSSQTYEQERGCVTTIEGGDCLPNPIFTAVPFLRINPGARTAAMGDAGLAIADPDEAMHFNASLLASMDKDLVISATYVPWLRNLGLTDVYMAYLSGAKRIDALSSVGFAYRFFSLGEITFTDFDGTPIGTSKPREFDLSIAYARKLSEYFSLALTGKYIYSNLTAGIQFAGGEEAFVGQSVAADLSMHSRIPIMLGNRNSVVDIGLSLSNIGSRISYTNDLLGDVLPSNLGLGIGWQFDVDKYNAFSLAIDMNKLLVPTPISPLDTLRYDVAPEDGIPDYKQKSLVNGALSSFYDAPGNFSEELSEVNFSFGLEYVYADQFALRVGYFYESFLKGDRQYFTIGFGTKFKALAIDLSYVIPSTNLHRPNDNTIRFGLSYAI